MSLTCKLVPVQYREYDYGLLRNALISVCSLNFRRTLESSLQTRTSFLNNSGRLFHFKWYLLGIKKARPTPRLVFFRGLIQTFPSNILDLLMWESPSQEALTNQIVSIKHILKSVSDNCKPNPQLGIPWQNRIKQFSIIRKYWLNFNFCTERLQHEEPFALSHACP